MTRHYKLENGKLIRFDSDGGNETLVAGVDGGIIGITRGEERTGFIFREGNNLNRLYLDNDGKPMTRLLILLVSRLERLTDGLVTVTSVTRAGAGRHASRLQLDFSGGDDCGEAPYYLPDDAYLRNNERIALVLSALDVMEDVEDSSSEAPLSSDAGESVVEPTVEPASESVVVEGTVQDASGSGRRVDLVRSLTVLALFYDHELDELCLDRDGDGDFVHRVLSDAPTNLFSVETACVGSLTSAKALKRGIRLATNACRGFLDRVAFITDQDEVRSLLQLHARRRGL